MWYDVCVLVYQVFSYTFVSQIPHDALIELLQSIAVQRISLGWEFKLPTDDSFIQRYQMVQCLQ